MGKADRIRQQNARQRIAAQQAAAKRAESRRRMWLAGGSVVAVLAVVLGLIFAKALTNSAAAKPAAAKSEAAVVKELTTVPSTEFDSVGVGPTGSNAVDPLKPISGASALTSNGKPEVLYVGEESCPYCGAERWAMTVALSRFGTFSNLHFIRSSSSDVYSNTATLTYYKASYTSKYLTFVPVEVATTNGKALENPTSAQDALLQKYSQGNFPFVDFGNQYYVSGASYLPSVLGSTYNPDPSHFGLTWQQIGAALSNPHSLVTESILGVANHMTAAICKMTHGQPGNVCNSKAVTSVSGNI
jgi:Domain of unknown function (DUF929)